MVCTVRSPWVLISWSIVIWRIPVGDGIVVVVGLATIARWAVTSSVRLNSVATTSAGVEIAGFTSNVVKEAAIGLALTLLRLPGRTVLTLLVGGEGDG